MAALLVMAAGCAPFKSYRLPVDASDAHWTFAPLASVASNLGLRYVVIDEAEVPAARREAKFAWAKKKADAVWKKAMAVMRSTGAMAPAGRRRRARASTSTST